ncbi:hypothetical protein ACIBI4_27640 [Streptomyces sp. NPDC050418]|uniref:hypothetical protein n=1 Tax=Streptomyces sp. NPDC050418 TaxID=3365612 RepID=UPI0037B263FC
MVLVIVGFAVRAPVKEWWLAREACGGMLPGADVEAVRSGERLGSEEETSDERTGAYHCALRNDEGKVIVAVNAFPPGSAQREELRFVGSAVPPHAVLPGGLPGFEAQNSRVLLRPECPGLPGDPLGANRRLLVDTWTYFAESRAEKAAMLRLAVTMTNRMADKLGCDAEPLPAPKKGAVPDTGSIVPRARAQGTACDVLATRSVPEEGRDGEVRIAIARGGIVGRCTLYAPRTEDSFGEKRLGRPLVELTTWRGEWSPALHEPGSGPGPLPMSGRTWKPALTEHRAWAVARCDGENTGFAAHWGYDNRTSAEREADGPYEPPTAAEKHRQRVQLREYVAAFAEDEVRREQCTGLKLPDVP